MAVILSSAAFRPGEYIPKKYTCQGEDVSPPLIWSDPAEDTKSYALIADEPDDTTNGFTHWLVYNIPDGTINLAEGVPVDPELPDGTLQGTNDFGNLGYRGPCPPSGSPHRYRFSLYALDQKLDLQPGISKTQLQAAMEGHILDQGELTGLFPKVE
jgi:Raf kinase inhibitor-like YbhB/YbcL family protein